MVVLVLSLKGLVGRLVLHFVLELLVLLDQLRHFQMHKLHHLLVLVNERFIVVLSVLLDRDGAGKCFGGQGRVVQERALALVHRNNNIDRVRQLACVLKRLRRFCLGLNFAAS